MAPSGTSKRKALWVLISYQATIVVRWFSMQNGSWMRSKAGAGEPVCEPALAPADGFFSRCWYRCPALLSLYYNCIQLYTTNRGEWSQPDCQRKFELQPRKISLELCLRLVLEAAASSIRLGCEHDPWYSRSCSLAGSRVYRVLEKVTTNLICWW